VHAVRAAQLEVNRVDPVTAFQVMVAWVRVARSEGIQLCTMLPIFLDVMESVAVSEDRTHVARRISLCQLVIGRLLLTSMSQSPGALYRCKNRDLETLNVQMYTNNATVVC
jgi:hypothetical protein